MGMHKSPPRSEYDDTPEPAVRYRPEPAAWSPPVPEFKDEPWRKERRMTPEEVAPYLAELKAKLGAAHNGQAVNRVDPALEARYLAACAAKRPAPVGVAG